MKELERVHCHMRHGRTINTVVLGLGRRMSMLLCTSILLGGAILLGGCEKKSSAPTKESAPVDQSPPVCTPFEQKVPRKVSCANDTMCKEFGYCGTVNGRCWPTDDNHCACSTRCKTIGACSLRKMLKAERRLFPGRTATCGAANDKDCAQSDGCKAKGLCRVGKKGACTK